MRDGIIEEEAIQVFVCGGGSVMVASNSTRTHPILITCFQEIEESPKKH